MYASSATDPAPLRPLLGKDDASVRAMAAAALLALGDRSGFAGLARSLQDAGLLRGSHPPISVGGLAAFTLSRYVVAVGVPGASQSDQDIATVATRWSDWLGKHMNHLRFDPSSGTWKLP